MSKYLTWVIVVLLAVVTLLGHTVGKLRDDRNRLRENQSALMSDVEMYEFRDSLQGASIQALNLTVKEFKRNKIDMTSVIEDLNLKLKRVESTSTTAVKTITRVERVPITQSTPTIRAPPTYAFEWQNRHTEIQGEIVNDSVDLRIYTIDTLRQVVHRVPRKFWFIKWGTKAIRQEVVSSNPNTEIIYTEYIRLVK